MPQVITESNCPRQAKTAIEFETKVTISSLYRRCDKFQHLESSKETLLSDKAISPADLWSYHQVYEVSVTSSNGQKLYKRVRNSQCRPRIRLQHLSKWRYYPHSESEELGQIASDSINRRLNLLLDDADKLIRTDSSVQQVSIDSKAPDRYQYPGLARKAPFLGARHLLRIRTELPLTEAVHTARQLAKIRKGHESKNSDWRQLMEQKVDPHKLLEAALGNGSEEFLLALQHSGRLPGLDRECLERLSRRPRLQRNIHLLGSLTPSASLMYFFAQIKNTEGLQRQITQSIPWAALLEKYHLYRDDQRTMNFLGTKLPTPVTESRESDDPAVRKNLASCAYQFSCGFNQLSPTVTALLEAGAGIEECLKYCPTNRGLAFKKYILQNFNILRTSFRQESPDVVYQRLLQEPDLAKTIQLSEEHADSAEIQLF